jgi:hypothetical protein
VERNRLRLIAAAQAAREARQSVTLENRIKDAERRARKRRVHVNREVHVIRQQVERGKMTSALAKLESLEALLDGVAHELAA